MSKITYILMEHKEAKIMRWHLSFKERDHVHPDGTQRGQNREVALVLHKVRSHTSWWHTKRPRSWGGTSRTYWWHMKRPKSWGGTFPSKSKITYILMAHKEAEIVRWHMSFNERDYIHTDGTRRGQNHEVVLILQWARSHTGWWHTKRPKSWGGTFPSIARSRTGWWHTKRPKSWGGTCPSKSEIMYILMAHKEAEIMRWHLSFKEQDHIQSDGTQRGQNCEVALILQRARSRTVWWHTKRPKLWGGTCPSKSEITYILMTHKEAEIVKWHFSFKEWDHIQSDRTQRGRNHEVALVLQRARSRTPWWHTKIVRWHLSFKERDHVQSDGTQRGQNRKVALFLQRVRSRTV
jgi:hypothetical protein